MIFGENTVFTIVQFDAQHGWPDVVRIGSEFLEKNAQAMLTHALNGVVKTVVIEKHYIDRDYRDTFSHYHSKRFTTPDSRTIRLHFFDQLINEVDLQMQNTLQPAYCGYAVIRPTRPLSLGRTLLDPNKLQHRMGFCRLCTEKVTLQGCGLTTQGFPFISQDTDAIVCAQSALWMLFRFFSNQYPHYREVRPFEVTMLSKDYSIGRVYPTHGLTDWQMAETCRQLGFSPLIYTREAYKNDFEHLIYTYIESGIPLLAATNNHVFPVFGHISDFKKALPAVPLVYSSYYNNGLVINDDNTFPYQRLWKDAVPTPIAADSKFLFGEIESFIAPLPEKVFLSAEQFRVLVEGILSHAILGKDTNSPILSCPTVIIRTYLTSGKSYKKAVLARGMGCERVRNLYLNIPLPHFIWVAELSVPGLYPEKIHGEIIWDATRNRFEPETFTAIHYPEKIFVDTGSALNMRPKIAIANVTSEPYSVYHSNLKPAL